MLEMLRNRATGVNAVIGESKATYPPPGLVKVVKNDSAYRGSLKSVGYWWSRGGSNP
jgi:hypothetical protein